MQKYLVNLIKLKWGVLPGITVLLEPEYAWKITETKKGWSHARPPTRRASTSEACYIRVFKAV